MKVKIVIHKEYQDVEVLLLPHKDSGKWSFINLTKGHICPCKFNSPYDAMDDLESYGDPYDVIEY